MKDKIITWLYVGLLVLVITGYIGIFFAFIKKLQGEDFEPVSFLTGMGLVYTVILLAHLAGKAGIGFHHHHHHHDHQQTGEKDHKCDEGQNQKTNTPGHKH